MSVIGVYRVTGSRAYRGHEPGTEFWARLEPRAESRALARGAIELLERVEAAIVPGTWKLPRGWTNDHEED